MKEKAIYIGDLHFEHEMWNKELNFADEEIKFLTKRLEEAVFFHEEEKDMMAQVEHFQNQFIVQKQNVDQFKHDIKMQEHQLAEFAKDHPVAVDHIHFNDHKGLRQNMEGFAKNYNDLKQEFREFVAHWK